MKKTVKNLITWSPSHLITSQKSAFTLAEVLITLAIIGVVAAMTIPTLTANYKEKAIVTKLTKTYAILSNAYQMMQAEYGTISTWGLSGTAHDKNYDRLVDEEGNYIYNTLPNEIISTRLQKYLKVAKTCEADGVISCLKRDMYNLNGELISSVNDTTTTFDTSAKTNFFLVDGTYISFGWLNYNGTSGDLMVILPNKTATNGIDRFYFSFNDKGLIPQGKTGNFKFEAHCDPAQTGTSSGFGCAAWVIYNKNLDYLHCREKLSWDGAHSCKEAK